MIKVMLAEDHVIVRDGIKMILEQDENIDIIAVAKNGIEVLDLLKKGGKTDVLLTDIQMPELDGINLIGKVKAIDPDIKIIMLSMHNDLSFLTQTFAQDANGYLLKGCSVDELLFAINYVAQGGKYISTELSLELADRYANHMTLTHNTTLKQDNDFSEREMEVLQLIGEGLTNYEISDRLFLSKRTVEGHRQSLLQKTNSNNTATLIKFAVLHGLVS
jgi:DNA-binding NarL/FixJ family response regulator